jgi:starch synthase
MKVLAVASELYPLVKTGGLADVVGALPSALAPHGVTVTTLVPGYPAVMAVLEHVDVMVSGLPLFGGEARILSALAKGIEVSVLDAPHLFNRPGNPYLGSDGKDWPDNAQRYAALSQVAARLARGEFGGGAFDIVHMHDWQAGLTAAYVKYYGGPPSVMTVHNLAFQGHFGAALFASLGLPLEAFAVSGVEYYGGVGFLKAGIALSSAITTVSPTYAREIQTVADGMGLDGLLRQRSNDVFGILNGIDTDVWNPETDDSIPATYSMASIKNRLVNKRAVEKRFALQADDSLLYCIVSRLTDQKGVDLVVNATDAVVASGARLAVLGSGDAVLQGRLLAAAEKHPGRIGVVIGYDESLSHLLQAGADAILIPSRFEPCGLTQLYGLRYGCVPVVARVGGLADTVIDANDAAIAAGSATGVQFWPTEQAAFNFALKRTSALYANRKFWHGMQEAGMRSDVSWVRSGQRYADLFKSLVGSS